MLRFVQMVFSVFGVNTYLAIDEATKQAAVIDPAMQNAQEQARFDKYIADNGITLTQIINTHLHLDHCFGLNYVKDKYGVPAKAHADDAPLAEMMPQQYAKFGMKGAQPIDIDVQLRDGDIVQIGESAMQVIHVPGHSPGGIALYYPEGKILISGDSLFRGSIGRTDIYGDYPTLIRSITHKLLPLPADVTVLPGHGEATTIAYEKQHNPYL